MRILVTGATGFLGAAVSKTAKAAGLDVVTAGRRPGAAAVVCDMGDPSAVWRMLGGVAPDAVVNCAATVDFAKDRLSALYPVNSLAPGLFAAWAFAAGAFIVQASGTLVHGLRTAFIDETTPIAPDSDYGRSKLLGDSMIESSGCAAAIVRIGGIFGAQGPDHLGLNRAIRAARQGQPPTLVGEGLARRNYVHVDDAAAALVDCATNRRQGVFYLGGRDVLTIQEMLQGICDIYCPDQPLVRRSGGEATDQVVRPSPQLPLGRGFAEALASEA